MQMSLGTIDDPTSSDAQTNRSFNHRSLKTVTQRPPNATTYLHPLRSLSSTNGRFRIHMVGVTQLLLTPVLLCPGVG